MKHVLFVCTGNTCRSPLAEYLLRERVGDQIKVKSAGVAAYDGGVASDHVETLLLEKGIKINHTSQMISEELIGWADLVLTMTESHKQHVVRMFPSKVEHIYTLKEYVTPHDPNVNISDPFGGSLLNYRSTMEELEELLDQFISKQKSKQGMTDDKE